MQQQQNNDGLRRPSQHQQRNRKSSVEFATIQEEVEYSLKSSHQSKHTQSSDRSIT